MYSLEKTNGMCLCVYVWYVVCFYICVVCCVYVYVVYSECVVCGVYVVCSMYVCECMVCCMYVEKNHININTKNKSRITDLNH